LYSTTQNPIQSSEQQLIIFCTDRQSSPLRIYLYSDTTRNYIFFRGREEEEEEKKEEKKM